MLAAIFWCLCWFRFLVVSQLCCGGLAALWWCVQSALTVFRDVLGVLFMSWWCVCGVLAVFRGGVFVSPLQQPSLLEASNAAWPCFAWQAWHFVTFNTCVVPYFVWQAQYFCDVFRRCVAFSGGAQQFGDCDRHFASQARHFRRVL